ncbi:MAG TPA: sugar ABC transporter ATP-binding protein [Polyangia bacterium]|nr:sugar ABC transporter ATP-binding protein [Polyangia bacterium]
MDESRPLVSFRHVSKRFPGARALEDVSFDVRRGSCHALCGENGAGKSTLAKLLAGIEQPDAGEIAVDGRVVHFEDPRDALAAGIGMVHQELAFCENLSVAENLCLGDLPVRGVFVQRGEMEKRAAAMLAAIDARLDVRRLVGDLTVAEQQMVQIAAAVGSGARVIIFDEPTSSLSQHETEHFYTLLDRLRARDVTCVFVSHRMQEIFRLCDTITVLRDGRHVATRSVETIDEAALVQLMIGRRLDEYLPVDETAKGGGGEVLRVADLSSPRRFADISFSVHAGEVVGIAGLVGAGRSDIAHAIFGLDKEARGRVEVAGIPLGLRSPAEAMRAGVGFVPEDRKRHGLVLSMRALENVTLPTLRSLALAGWLRAGAEDALAADAFARLRVRAPDLDAVTAGLSGGNQQKLVLAKWLAARCRVLILDEPTRGVDVGAKAEIHALIGRLAAEGTGILLISSELPELVALSTRILVLRDGRMVGALAREEADPEALLRMMAGLDPSGRRLRV